MSTTAYELAIRKLERLLHRGPRVCGLPAAWQQGHELVGTLAELGLLDAEQQQAWTERFDHVAARGLPTPDDDVRARARALLADELDRQDATPDALLDHRARFEARLQALLEIAVIDRDEHHLWSQRLDERQSAPPAVAKPSAYLARELRAVAIAPDVRLGGLRLTAVELFDDCVLVRWHLLVDEQTAWREHTHPFDYAADLAETHGPSALHDDLDTIYTPAPEEFPDLDRSHRHGVV